METARKGGGVRGGHWKSSHILSFPADLLMVIPSRLPLETQGAVRSQGDESQLCPLPAVKLSKSPNLTCKMKPKQPPPAAL